MFGLIGLLLNSVRDIGGQYLNRKTLESKGKIDIALKRAEAIASVQMSRAEAQVEWEKTMATGSISSWKDEWWTVILTAPLVLAFFPPAVPWVAAGFEVLRDMPEWYMFVVVTAIGAAFGVKLTDKLSLFKKTK